MVPDTSMEVDEAVEEAEQQEPEEVVEDPDENNGEPQVKNNTYL